MLHWPFPERLAESWRGMERLLDEGPAQAILRWNQQHGWVPIPKSEDPVRMRANLDLEGFRLSDGEMARIDALDRGQRFNIDPGAAIEVNLEMAVPA